MTSLLKHTVAQLNKYTVCDANKKFKFVQGAGIGFNGINLKKEKL